MLLYQKVVKTSLRGVTFQRYIYYVRTLVVACMDTDIESVLFGCMHAMSCASDSCIHVIIIIEY